MAYSGNYSLASRFGSGLNGGNAGIAQAPQYQAAPASTQPASPAGYNFGAGGSVTNAPQYYWNAATAVANRPYQPYGGQQVANFNQDQQNAYDAIRQRAANGSPVMQAGQQQLTDTLSGKYLSPDSNPYLAQIAKGNANRMADAYARGTAAQTMGQFNSAGAFGGSAQQEYANAQNQAFADSVGQMNNQLYGDAYQNERQNQMRGMLFAPQMANADYQDAQALLGVGNDQYNQQQKQLTSQYNDWQNAQNYPLQQLDILKGGSGMSAQQQQYNLQQQQLDNSKPSSGMSWLGGGLGVLGTLGGMSNNSYGAGLLNSAGNWLSGLWSN